MGCRESKHIATDNTIITRTSSTKSTNRGQDDNDKNNVQSLQKSRSKKSTMQKQESLKENNVGGSKANNVLNEHKKSGDDKGTENQKVSGKLKETNDHQVVQGDKELIKENAKVGDEAIIKEKEDQNGNLGDNGGKELSVLIPKEDLPSTSTKDGESIEVINSNDVSGASVYSTPTAAAGAFDNTKTENAEEKKEPVEETKDTRTVEETTAKENLTRIVDAISDSHVQEAEVDEKIKDAEAAVAAPENHLQKAEVEEKIKDAEAAVESLEKLVAIKNPVKETEEIPAKEVEATNSSIQNAEKGKSEEILKTQVAATDATPPIPVEQTDKSEEYPGTETKTIDATLQTAVTESDKTKENLIKEAGEAVENGVKEIHEVTGKAEEIPVKNVETSHEAKQEYHTLVADKAEEVSEKNAEADKVEEDLVTAAEAANTAMKNLESVAKLQSQDATNTEEDTKTSSTANERQISKEDPDVQRKPDDFEKQ